MRKSPIFLADDVDGQMPVLHEASFEGFVAGRNAAAFPLVHKSRRTVPLSIMFTDPPLAVIGAPPSEDSIPPGPSSTHKQRTLWKAELGASEPS